MTGSKLGRLALGIAVAAVVLVTVYGTAVAQRGEEADDLVELGNIGAAEQALSGPQQMAWVGEQLAAGGSIRQQVEGMLEEARKEKETLKITCLDDKLAQIIVNLKGMEERGAALQAAIQGADNASANQHFMILKIYAARLQGLKAEAESCVGDSDVVLGETETILEIDEGITAEDPSEGGIEIPWVDQPPQASGFY